VRAIRIFNIAQVLLATAGCQRPAMAAHDAAHTQGVPDAGVGIRGVDASVPVASPGYPVDTGQPKDAFNEQLLRTLAREAAAVVVCRLQSLTDIFPQHRDPDVFYDAACEVTESIAGSPKDKPLHFIWQVERGNRMPPPQSDLLVYLKARKKPIDGPPELKWVALDTGVMHYTPTLKERLHRSSKKNSKQSKN